MDNFFSFIDQHGPVPAHKPELGPCWLWMGQHHKQGYGMFSKRIEGRKNSKTYLAHRVAYERLIGPIPEGLVLDHLCRNTGCANPYHTEPVPQIVNILRGEGYAAKCARKTHCKRGHSLIVCPWNNVKRRYCPECRRINRRNKYATRKVG
jgi:hypothetical protein